MVINFNTERLDKLLYDFYLLTGLTVSVWDANLNMLGYQPKEMCNFCRKIREYSEGNRRCFLSDKEVFNECERTGQPATRVCHAGLIDNAVPIKFQDKILGYMMFGQAVGADKKKAYPSIRKVSKDLNIDCDLLMKYYGELDVYNEEKIKADENGILTYYLADIIDAGDYVGETNAVENGIFTESSKRSAPYFDIIIDGITVIGE